MLLATLSGLNQVELKCYSFIVTLNKCHGRWYCVNDLSAKVFVLSKTKNINVKGFNIGTNRNEAKTLLKHISCDCTCKFSSATCNLNQKLNNKTC